MKKWSLLGAVLALIAGASFFAFPKQHAIEVVVPPSSTNTNESATIVFVGDIMLDRQVRAQIEREQDPLYPFARIAPVIQKADLAFANLEGPISARGKNQGSKYSFRFEPVGTIHALTFAGFDVLSIANNHIWDWGKDALLDTISHLETAGIGFVGAGANEYEANAPYLKQVGDASVAFLGYTNLYPESLEAGADYAGISSFSLERAGDLTRSLKEGGEADIVIISLHWGQEYETQSDASQQKVARALIDAGADMVVGHHPHVVQEVEQYQDGWIAYSLGNFVFDQFFSEETMEGLLLTATVQDKKIATVEQSKVKLTQTFQPYLIGKPGDPALE